MAEEESIYQPVDAIAETIKTSAVLSVGGFTVSAVQNALARENLGMLAVFTRTGGVIVNCALVGAGYAFTKGAAANLRRKKDAWNDAMAGFAGGAILGLRSRSLPLVFANGAGLGVILGVLEYCGGSLTGYKQDPNVDEFERKMALRAAKRRPIQETIDELGEGRGIYAPGYAERRRERLKQAYGIDVSERKGSVAL